MIPWKQHLRRSLDSVSVYDVVPASSDLARLHANECPEPWPDEAMDIIADAVRSVELGRYPDTSGRSLRAILAERYGCDPERIVLGNGSDEIIKLLVTALSGGEGTVVVPTPTFVMYEHSAQVLGMTVKQVPTDAEFQLDPEAMRGALADAALCFLARPNNPTGVLWDAGVISGLIAEFPGTVFVVDEAYGAYAPGSSVYRPDAPPNQVHMATLSKVGAAAIRLGYCIADRDLAVALNKVRAPYNISATTLAIAQTLLTTLAGVREDLVTRSLGRRERLAAILARLPGAHVYPSSSNLVLTRLGSVREASALCAFLFERGVFIKDVSRTPGLEGCVRASLGTDADLDRLEAGLSAWRAQSS